MESFDSSQDVRLPRMKAQHFDFVLRHSIRLRRRTWFRIKARHSVEAQHLIRIRARLHRLHKSSGFDFALKGRGFKPRHTKYEKNCGFSR